MPHATPTFTFAGLVKSNDLASNTVMTSIAQAEPNSTITIELQDGYLQATVNAKQSKN